MKTVNMLCAILILIGIAMPTNFAQNPAGAYTSVPTSLLACPYQGPASPITGTGTLAIVYTCSVPPAAPGTGIHIIYWSKHTTGTAAVLYQLSFGGTATTASQPSGSSNQLQRMEFEVINNVGVQNAQTMTTTAVDSNSGTVNLKLDTAAVNWSSAVPVTLQFNVASSDAVTPEQFIVEWRR